MNWSAHEVGVDMTVAVFVLGVLGVLVGRDWVGVPGVPVRIRVGVSVSVGLGVGVEVGVLVGGVPDAVAVTVAVGV